MPYVLAIAALFVAAATWAFAWDADVQRRAERYWQQAFRDSQ